jgi:hypothetical protein
MSSDSFDESLFERDPPKPTEVSTPLAVIGFVVFFGLVVLATVLLMMHG